MQAELWTCRLGTVRYREAHDAAGAPAGGARRPELIPDVLLLLEHPPVYTRTRRTAASDLPMGEDWYAARGIEIVDTDRGGKLTYHGPGQLVGYPIARIGHVLPFVRDARARGRRRAARLRACARTREPTSPRRSSARGSRTARSPRSASA